MNPNYTVYRTKTTDKNDDRQVGPIHGAVDDLETICGLKITYFFWINKNRDIELSDITCKKCLKVLKGN